jgi:hypothetical protein
MSYGVRDELFLPVRLFTVGQLQPGTALPRTGLEVLCVGELQVPRLVSDQLPSQTPRADAADQSALRACFIVGGLAFQSPVWALAAVLRRLPGSRQQLPAPEEPPSLRSRRQTNPPLQAAAPGGQPLGRQKRAASRRQ